MERCRNETRKCWLRKRGITCTGRRADARPRLAVENVHAVGGVASVRVLVHGDRLHYLWFEEEEQNQYMESNSQGQQLAFRTVFTFSSGACIRLHATVAGDAFWRGNNLGAVLSCDSTAWAAGQEPRRWTACFRHDSAPRLAWRRTQFHAGSFQA